LLARNTVFTEIHGFGSSEWLAKALTLVLSFLQQVQVPAGLTPAEFVIQRRFFFVVPNHRSERRVTASDAGPLT